MMMMMRSVLLATALLAATITTAFGQSRDDVIAAPVLRANVTVSGEVVRIGDVIDNAGSSAQIAIYRAPDLGTTGTLPTAQVLSALRAHQVIGVDTRDLREIQVTRLARTLDTRDIELAVARALEHRSGLGDAANLSLTFDRDVQDLKLDASNSGAMLASAARFDARNNRFDVTFEISNENAATPARLRFTGTAGDVVSVLNRQSKRTVSGTVTGRGQISISVATPRPQLAPEATSSLGPDEAASPVAVAASNTPVAPKAE